MAMGQNIADFLFDLDWKHLVECPMAKYTTDIEQDWFECYDESRHLESHGGMFLNNQFHCQAIHLLNFCKKKRFRPFNNRVFGEECDGLELCI